jgi:hypothetical protein
MLGCIAILSQADVAANELPRFVAQTFCLPYRRLAACKVREGTVR